MNPIAEMATCPLCIAVSALLLKADIERSYRYAVNCPKQKCAAITLLAKTTLFDLMSSGHESEAGILSLSVTAEMHHA